MIMPGIFQQSLVTDSKYHPPSLGILFSSFLHDLSARVSPSFAVFEPPPNYPLLGTFAGSPSKVHFFFFRTSLFDEGYFFF